MSLARWKSAPRFKNSDLANLNEGRAEQIFAFYALREPRLAPTGRQSTPKDATNRRASSLKLASDIIGRRVITQDNKPSGAVSDLVLDMSGGMRPAFAVISSDRLFKKEQSYALPLKLLKFVSGSPSLMIESPRLPSAHSPPFTDQAWNASKAGGGGIFRYAENN